MLLGTISFVMVQFLSLEYVLFVAIVSFCADATSTIICTRKGFFEKHLLYAALRKKLDFSRSIAMSGIVYVSFLGAMHLCGMLFEGIVAIGVLHGYGSISNTTTLFMQKSQVGATVK